MQLFGGKLIDPDSEKIPRTNFDDIFSAAIAVFSIITVEDYPGHVTSLTN